MRLRSSAGAPGARWTKPTTVHRDRGVTVGWALLLCTYEYCVQGRGRSIGGTGRDKRRLRVWCWCCRWCRCCSTHESCSISQINNIQPLFATYSTTTAAQIPTSTHLIARRLLHPRVHATYHRKKTRHHFANFVHRCSTCYLSSISRSTCPGLIGVADAFAMRNT